MAILGDYLKAKFGSLDRIDLLFTLMLEKEENLWGHWTDALIPILRGTRTGSFGTYAC